MEKKFAIVVGLMMVMFLSLTGTSFADQDEVRVLKDQINALNQKLTSLESQVMTMKGHISATPGKELTATNVVPPGEVTEAGLIHTLQDIHMGGYVETQWNNNFQQPKSVANTNNLRVFDVNDGSFTINAAELDFQKEANPEGGAGFRVDIAMGSDAKIVDAATNGTSVGGDTVTLQQAFVELVTPLKFWEGNSILPGSIKTIAGRYVTLAGAEVIEQKDNWNISRSIGFGFSIPFTHTGVRTNFKLFNNFLDTYLGLNNGWDDVIDNNSYKTLEAGFGWSPLDKVSIFNSLYWGPEVADQAGHRRFLISNVVKWEATDKLTFMYDFDFGAQHRVPDGAAIDRRENKQWFENAAYARYQRTKKLAAATRFEIFVDKQGFRTAAAPRFPSDRTWDQTFTLEYKLYENLITRLEYRLDHSNDDKPFTTQASQGLSGGEKNQNTIGASLIYNFA